MSHMVGDEIASVRPGRPRNDGRKEVRYDRSAVLEVFGRGFVAGAW